jgi:hypothetical protein
MYRRRDAGRAGTDYDAVIFCISRSAHDSVRRFRRHRTFRAAIVGLYHNTYFIMSTLRGYSQKGLDGLFRPLMISRNAG